MLFRSRSLLDGGRIREASAIFARLWRDWPHEHRFGIRYAVCLQQLDNSKSQRKVVETLIERRAAEQKIATKELLTFHKELYRRALEQPDKINQTTLQTLAKSIGEKTTPDKIPPPPPTTTEDPPQQPENTDATDATKAIDLSTIMSMPERKRYNKLIASARPNPYMQHYMLGTALFHEGQYQQAITELEKAATTRPDNSQLQTLIGQSYLKMLSITDAARAFRRSLKTNPQDAEAIHGLADIALRLNKNRLAQQRARQSLAARFHSPKTHHILGLALLRQNRPRLAARAFHTAVRQNPAHLASHKELEKLYADQLDDQTKANEHTAIISDLQTLQKKAKLENPDKPPRLGKKIKFDLPTIADDPKIIAQRAALAAQPPCDITIVSGLPRSGTSMMMQMLAAGGMPILADDHRPADIDNPRGYLEDERAKKLATDRTWLPEADGKAVKIILQLLPHLPPKPHKYTVILMRRPIEEVVESQTTMLNNQGKESNKLPPEKLRLIFTGQYKNIQQWAQQAPHIRLLEIDYHETLRSPLKITRQVCSFLDRDDLDSQAAAAAIDPSLYRSKATSQKSVQTTPTE